MKILSEYLVNRLPYIGVQVHRIHKIHILVFSSQVPDGVADGYEALPEILSPVTRDQDKATSG